MSTNKYVIFKSFITFPYQLNFNIFVLGSNLEVKDLETSVQQVQALLPPGLACLGLHIASSLNNTDASSFLNKFFSKNKAALLAAFADASEGKHNSHFKINNWNNKKSILRQYPSNLHISLSLFDIVDLLLSTALVSRVSPTSPPLELYRVLVKSINSAAELTHVLPANIHGNAEEMLAKSCYFVRASMSVPVLVAAAEGLKIVSERVFWFFFFYSSCLDIILGIINWCFSFLCTLFTHW